MTTTSTSNGTGPTPGTGSARATGARHAQPQGGHDEDNQSDLQAPGVLRLAMEFRAPWELGLSMLTAPLMRMAPAGDGHPVLVFPGLAASDTSTVPLRSFLGARGHDVRPWGLGRNLGPGRGVLEAVFDKVRTARRETGRKVSLVGWSLGGIYAREAAKIAREDVRSVITLGTPFAGPPRATNAWRIYEMASGEKAHARAASMDLATAPPVPTTSIYSRTDGIVAWQCSVQQGGRRDTENIEVEASHIGLGMNPTALFALADRLAQPEGEWQPFDRSIGLRAWFYGDPGRPDWHPKSAFV